MANAVGAVDEAEDAIGATLRGEGFPGEFDAGEGEDCVEKGDFDAVGGNAGNGGVEGGKDLGGGHGQGEGNAEAGGEGRFANILDGLFAGVVDGAEVQYHISLFEVEVSQNRVDSGGRIGDKDDFFHGHAE